MVNPSRVRVKICGITRTEDALAAAEAGADAIGLVFYPASPRAVSMERAREICQALPPFVSSVGLFVNAAAAEVARVLEQVPLDMLQFHGDETPPSCSAAGRPFLKALRVKAGSDIRAQFDAWCVTWEGASGLLLDAWHDDLYGGGGRPFDWALVESLNAGKPVILAGGLNPENVAEAIGRTRPWGVDVSTGVEESPGIKTADRIRAFISAVNTAGEQGGS